MTPPKPISGHQVLDKALRSISPKALQKARDQVSQVSNTPVEIRVASDSERARASTAERFSSGLDAVTDVLLLLVLKFGRATSFLVACGLVLLACLAALIVSIVKISDSTRKSEDVLLQIERIEHDQQGLEKKVIETKSQVDRTARTVDRVEAKLNQ